MFIYLFSKSSFLSPKPQVLSLWFLSFNNDLTSSGSHLVHADANTLMNFTGQTVQAAKTPFSVFQDQTSGWSIIQVQMLKILGFLTVRWVAWHNCRELRLFLVWIPGGNGWALKSHQGLAGTLLQVCRQLQGSLGRGTIGRNAVAWQEENTRVASEAS